MPEADASRSFATVDAEPADACPLTTAARLRRASQELLQMSAELRGEAMQSPPANFPGEPS